MHPDVPNKPPLELVTQNGLWVVEAYRQGARDGETFTTHDTQLNALRHAKSMMEANRHPCLVRWDSPDSVGGLYWNPLFESLTVRPDELVGGWAVVPQQGTCAMAVVDSRKAAAERGKRLQERYDFKHLRAYDGHGDAYEERDHRFLRYDITRAGVRFDTDAVPATPEPSDDGSTDTVAVDTDSPVAPADDDFVKPMDPSRLSVSIPDVTRVEFTDTDGAVHRYSTPWAGGTRAQIRTLSRKYATDAGVPTAFDEMVARWQAADESAHVATIYESGTDPAPWVAYRVSERSLADLGAALPPRVRLDILGDVATAVTTVEGASSPVCGLRPTNIHVYDQGTGHRATVANWGLEWAVREAVGMTHTNPFLSPEQREGTLSETTAVYQLGGLAHWLLCGATPPTTLSPAASELSQPGDGISPSVRSVIARALAADPADRYGSVESFHQALVKAVDV